MTHLYTPLFTDLYQITMAYGYWKLGMHEQEAVFHLLFRRTPFKGHYALNAGLARVIDFLNSWQFSEDDLAYLSTLRNAQQEKLFPNPFLDYLKQLKFSCDLEAIPEGTLVFPHAPILRVQGPLLQCQLLESPLLNLINFQTLIATKASRVIQAAAGDDVIEFGMRRAQGPDGALSASRASYIGGCVATSNTLAGKLFDIPVRGTHAHSWVTAFDTEEAAFQAYATVMPNNCLLLVDTYNTIKGVEHAVNIGKKLRASGKTLLGIRLDSGDMATLSVKAKKILMKEGFSEADILASNSLDEYVIRDLKEKGAKITAWGVGTNLATAYDQPALDGVYKLSALKNATGEWVYKLKLSEQPIKISNPGLHQVRRFFSDDRYFVDMIYDLNLGTDDMPEVVLLDQTAKKIHLDNYDAFVDLLEPIFKAGKLIYQIPSIHDTRKEAMNAVSIFYDKVGDKPYAVGLEKRLYDKKQELIRDIRQEN